MQHDQFQLHADIEQRHWWFVGRRQILQSLVVELLPPAPESLIVDVGCGTGANIASLAERYRCVGIDTSAEAIQFARHRFPAVQFLVGGAPADLGELAAQARLYLLTDVLEHVADDYRMFSELLAAASPGTHFLITVPADASLWSEHDESFGHYRRYAEARLAAVWSELPVTTLLLSYFNSRLLPVIRGVRWWTRRRGEAAGQAGTDFWIPRPPVNAALRRIFSGESKRLLACLGGRKRPYAGGASLVALVRREPGTVAVRSKPADLPPDQHDPSVR